MGLIDNQKLDWMNLPAYYRASDYMAIDYDNPDHYNLKLGLKDLKSFGNVVVTGKYV